MFSRVRTAHGHTAAHMFSRVRTAHGHTPTAGTRLCKNTGTPNQASGTPKQASGTPKQGGGTPKQASGTPKQGGGTRVLLNGSVVYGFESLVCIWSNIWVRMEALGNLFYFFEK